MSEPKLILGVDPGIAVTGWGVIERRGGKSRLVGHGTIATSSRDRTPVRLSLIHAGILEVIDNYRPQDAAIEAVFAGINIKTAIALGQARGAIIVACGQRGLEPVDYTPLAIKQAVVGYGRAGKEQVQQMVKALLGLARAPQPDHVADALGVAICHAHSRTAHRLGMGAGAL